MDSCRLGIVGLGSAGAAMLEAAIRHSGIQVVGVADPRVDVLPVPGGIRRYHSLDELLCDTEVGVDAVYIATPTTCHDTQILACLSAGRHVMVEKPVTATSADARRLIAKARKQRRHVVVGHSESFEPYVRAAASVILGGEIGTPRVIISARASEWMRRPRLEEEFQVAKGGGIVLRQGSHQLDVVRFIAGGGVARVVTASARNDPVRGQPGSYLAWLLLKSGIVAIVGHDATGALAGSLPLIPGKIAGGEEYAKRERSDALFASILAGGLAGLGASDLSLLVVVGSAGYLWADPFRLQISSKRAGPEMRTFSHLSDGRTAALDELIAATHGTVPLHDLAWGFANLRCCEQINQISKYTDA